MLRNALRVNLAEVEGRMSGSGRPRLASLLMNTGREAPSRVSGKSGQVELRKVGVRQVIYSRRQGDGQKGILHEDQ